MVFLLCGSDNLIPKLPNTAYSCGQQVPVTTWFRSARPGNAIPVPKTSTMLRVGGHVYRNGIASKKESCGLRENVFET